MHIYHDDEKYCCVAMQDGFDIRLMCQIPNSTTLNPLDLEFSRTIQFLQHSKTPKIVDELVTAFMKSYEDFSTLKFLNIFLTLQSCMIKIMRTKGSHKYNIQNLRKTMLDRKCQASCSTEM